MCCCLCLLYSCPYLLYSWLLYLLRSQDCCPGLNVLLPMLTVLWPCLLYYLPCLLFCTAHVQRLDAHIYFSIAQIYWTLAQVYFTVAHMYIMNCCLELHMLTNITFCLFNIMKPVLKETALRDFQPLISFSSNSFFWSYERFPMNVFMIFGKFS